jgi:enamine deaminase RidA (YjgF/YER057c/UK114 family)
VSLERVDPDTLYPAHGFAHAVVATGGRTVYVGGQVATDMAGEVLAAGDYEKQSYIALHNFALALEACGAMIADIVQLNVYIVDSSPARQDKVLAGLASAAAEIGLRRPTMKVLGVQALGSPAALVEFDGIAVCD